MLGIVPYNFGEGAAHEYPASGGETMKPAFELAAFTVRDGAEAAMLAERQAMIGSLSQAFPGLLAAWLAQRDDGSWLDVEDIMNDLSGQTTIVVGASRGLGRGIATAFAEAGVPVVAVSRTRPVPGSRNYRDPF